MGKTREQQKAYIKTIGVNALPDAPSQDGYGPAQIKQAFSEGVEQEMDFRHEYEESNDLNITALQTSLQSLSALVNDIVAGVYVIDKATKDGDGNVITSTYLKIVDLQNGIIGALKYVKSNGELENIHKIASDLETLSLAYNTFVNGYFTGDSAKKALVATKAINDIDGKPIKTTYATIVNLQTLSTNLTQILNGTTVVDKARKDQNGDVISNTYIKIANIINNLTSSDTNKPLSAYQGKVLKTMIDNINTLLQSDDTSLDQLQEIVTYIKNNKSLIDGITLSKVSVSDIVDNVTSQITNKPLSAKQGYVLKGLINNIVSGVTTVAHATSADKVGQTTEAQIVKSVNGVAPTNGNVGVAGFVHFTTEEVGDNLVLKVEYQGDIGGTFSLEDIGDYKYIKFTPTGA